MSVDDRHAGTAEDLSGDGPGRGTRLVRRVIVWLVAVAVWVFVCFTWLFPWVTELGLDPTLGS